MSDVGDQQLDCMVFEIMYEDNLYLDTVRYHVVLIDPDSGLLSFSRGKRSVGTDAFGRPVGGTCLHPAGDVLAGHACRRPTHL